MYLAIDEEHRNKGFGSLVLRDLNIKYGTILLCIEKISAESEDIKTRRKEFYLRNGFYEKNCFIEDSGVEYEFLASSKERILTECDLKKRYSSMTRNPLVKDAINVEWVRYKQPTVLPFHCKLINEYLEMCGIDCLDPDEDNQE